MIKRFMMLITAMFITTLAAQTNTKPEKAEFTVTQLALDAAASKAAEEATKEDTNETQPEGGDAEER